MIPALLTSLRFSPITLGTHSSEAIDTYPKSGDVAQLMSNRLRTGSQVRSSTSTMMEKRKSEVLYKAALQCPWPKTERFKKEHQALIKL